VPHMVLMGMGITGRAVATALTKRGVTVTALDDHLSDELREWGAANGVKVVSPADIDVPAVLADAEALLPAPGLPEHHPIFAAAAASEVPVRSEFDLAASWDDRPIVAVTGTDGKTTVVTLIERMLERSGLATHSVGNTDTPWVEAIEDPSLDVFVVEASSFRLGHSQSFSPQVATWLNFGPDHLDNHVDLGAYEAAKAKIWAELEPGAVAIANRQDPVVAAHASSVTATVQTFGADEPPTALDHGVVDDMLVVGGDDLMAISDLPRSMPHDVLNALAATASALAIGGTRSAAVDVLREFTGLEHRVELIGELRGVRFVNDSKATTPHASAAAIGGFDSIILLAGGKNKGLSFAPMLDHVSRIKHVVALGEAADDIEAVFATTTPTSSAASMAEAVDQAMAVATSGDVVLLSPACASYDWYKSYVHRGQDFTAIIRSLLPATGEHPQGGNS